MNGTFQVKSQTNNVTFEYKTTTMIVQGGYNKDATTTTLQSVNGTCYRVDKDGNMGEFLGNFNGYARDDQNIKYSMSEMSRKDANEVWDAIDEIEPEITGK